MKIDVFGAILIDQCIDDKGETTESIGGSGLNIARGLHLLGHDVQYISNIGNDVYKDTVFKTLELSSFPTQSITIRQGKTGLFISQNNQMKSVERGVNALPLTLDTGLLRNECAIITTEIHESSLEKILSFNWKNIFLDIGPRPQILDNLSLPQNCVTIGNVEENKIKTSQIVKLGPKGANWNDIKVPGSNMPLPYTVGAGDLFDTILIDNILKGKSKKTALSSAVEHAEKGCYIKNTFKLEGLI